MDQNTIVAGLKQALSKGSGSLSDLEALLNRAQEDITKAKQEEAARVEAEHRAQLEEQRRVREEALRKAKEELEKRRQAEAQKAKRGQEIAELATRVLDGKPTADDVAIVFGAYLKSEGIDANVTAETVKESIKNSKEFSDSIEELGSAITELFQTFASAIKSENNENVVKKTPPKDYKKDADAALDDFLRDLGLR